MEWGQIAQATWFGIVNGVNYALFATGLTLIFGIMSVVNFAHGELFMLGAILVYVLMTFLGMNFFLAAIIAISLVAAFGIIFNRIAVRPLIASPAAVILATVAISMILLNGVAATIGPTAHLLDAPVTGVMQIANIRVSTVGVMIFFISSAVITATLLFIRGAKIGKDMRATIQNPVAASLCGINTVRVYDYTLIMASGLAAIGGIMLAVLNIADPYMGGTMLIKGFAIVIAAGLGNLTGAIILGVAIGIAESLFSFFVIPYFRETFIYGIMVLILLLRPEGLFTRRG